jgi:AraC family transcriptional regulator, regulatory protein of adaptative response / DNA-3-methyladenine glycosylase II
MISSLDAYVRKPPDAAAASNQNVGMVQLDEERCYTAMLAREHRFDGEFYIAVKTTGVYCRPSCPTPIQPKRKNIEFHRTAASAQLAGFRSCKRCRPDASTGNPARLRNNDLAGRALRLIEDGLVDRGGVSGLANELALSERQLGRVLMAELGAGPLALARARRANTARMLVESTELGIGEIAFAAGFASIRQFNDTIRTVYGTTPTELRAGRRSRHAPSGISVRLPYREPFDASGLLDFLSRRAVTGVEAGDATSYARSLRLPGGPGVVRVEHRRDGLYGTFWLTSLSDLGAAIARIRMLFDLDADPVSIGETFTADPALGPIWNQFPGRRAPGAVDAGELAVKAVLGQQVSVAGARTLAGRLVERHGTSFTLPDAPLNRLFPSSADLAAIDPATVGIPMARAKALVGMCAAIAEGRIDLHIGADRPTVRAQLVALPGIGPWTANYVAMRALADPDALLDDDLGVIHGARALGLPDKPKLLAAHGARWSPWRSYATQLLWAAVPPSQPSKRSKR